MISAHIYHVFFEEVNVLGHTAILCEVLKLFHRLLLSWCWKPVTEALLELLPAQLLQVKAATQEPSSCFSTYVCVGPFDFIVI